MEAECDEEGGNWLRRVLQQSYCQHDLDRQAREGDMAPHWRNISLGA